MARSRDRQEELVRLLVSMQLQRNVARTLVCLASMEECTSFEMERATGLRQPEVSIAVQELRDRCWVEKRDIRRERKGRPVHSYRLALPFDRVLLAVEALERARIRRMEQDLRRLKMVSRRRPGKK